MAQLSSYGFATLLLFALTINAEGAEKAEDCNLAGDGEQESKEEKAVRDSLAPLRNKVFRKTIADKENNYTYAFKVCGTAANISGAGLVQIDNNDKGKETAVGRISDTHLIRGTDWIMLMYMKGEPYDSHCNKEERKAMVMISCNSKTDGDNFMMVSEERAKVQNCFYLFEMDSKVACPPEDTSLGVGSILLIVFASLVATYLIVGFLYQRLVVGAKGMEQIPNYRFWQDLGNFMADGCDIVCRSRPRNIPTTYRGVGDDQLGEEPEERDDHLLPM